MHIGLKIFIWGVLGLVVFGALLFGLLSLIHI